MGKRGKVSAIAKKANVSKSTVSNVLSGKRYVSEELRNKVLKVSEELNYSHESSSHLSRHLHKVISLALNNENFEKHTAFEQEIIKGILNVCAKHDYHLLLKNKRITQVTKNTFPMDGEILLNPKENERIQADVHHVWIGTPPLRERGKTPYVDNDNELIGYMITEYLIKKGHKQISFFNSHSNNTVSNSRKRGYLQALEEYQYATDTSLHVYFDEEPSSYQAVYDKTTELFDHEKGPVDAIIANSDAMAEAIYKACEDSQKSIPDDLSVIAIYADSKTSDTFLPTLSRIDLNPYLLGVEAAKLLFSSIGYEKTTGGGAIVPTAIIEKKSVKSRKE